MKIKEIKIRQDDGSYSDPIPVGADAVNVDYEDGISLKNKIEEIEKTKRDVSDKIELNDLSESVKASMTGGTIPFVGKKSVGQTNIQSNSINTDMLNFVTIDSNNIFDPTALNFDYYYNTAGNKKTDGSYVCTDFLKIDSYEKNITELWTTSFNGNWTFWDNDKNFIGTSASNGKATTINYDNVKYFVFTIKADSDFSNRQIIINENPLYKNKTNLQKAIINKKSTIDKNSLLVPAENIIGTININSLDNIIKRVSNNLFNKETLNYDGYFNTKGIFVTRTDANNYICSDFIDIGDYVPNETIFYQAPSPYSGFILFFDEDYNHIGGITDSTANYTTFTIPMENVKFIVKDLTVRNNLDLNNYYIQKETREDIYDYYIVNPDIAINFPNSILKDKKIGFLGDSITYGLGVDLNSRYSSIISNNTGCISYNYGISGNSLAKAGSNGQQNAQNNPMCTRYIDMDDNCDYVVVFGGCNDYAYQIPIGDENSTDISTFNGGLNILIEGLIEKYPGKPILFLTPLYRALAHEDGYKFMDYVNAIKSRTSYHSIPYFNLTDRSTIKSLIDTINNKYYYNKDRLHPNEEGHKILARIIQHQLELL